MEEGAGVYAWSASWYVGVVVSFRNGSRRSSACGITIIAFTLGACAPVMTTRYREVPLTGPQRPSGETYRFELADGSNVDMHVNQINHPMVSGQHVSGGPALVDLREIRRVGVAFEEKDAAATNIKYFMLGSVGYAAFVLGLALLASQSR